MAAGDVYKIYVVFQDEDGGKERYVVQVGNTQIEIGVTVSSITSQYENKSEEIKARYYPVKDWKAAGLTKPSYVDIRSKNTYSVLEVMQGGKHVGSLSAQDMIGLYDFIRSYKTRMQALKARKAAEAVAITPEKQQAR